MKLQWYDWSIIAIAILVITIVAAFAVDRFVSLETEVKDDPSCTRVAEFAQGVVRRCDFMNEVCYVWSGPGFDSGAISCLER